LFIYRARRLTPVKHPDNRTSTNPAPNWLPIFIVLITATVLTAAYGRGGPLRANAASIRFCELLTITIAKEVCCRIGCGGWR
jgi:hypothetical protein